MGNIVKLAGNRVVDLDELGRDELVDLKLYVEDALSTMKSQIDDAKWKLDGKYADRDWFASVNAAARIYGRNVVRINQTLAKMNRDEKKRSGLERRFMEAARLYLSDIDFKSILGIATREDYDDVVRALRAEARE